MFFAIVDTPRLMIFARACVVQKRFRPCKTSLSPCKFILCTVFDFTTEKFLQLLLTNLNVPSDETVKRFQTKSNVSYTEQDMKRWWNEKDLLGFDNEKIISKDMSADDTVKMILKNCTKNIS
ncbi:MAG: hypothetical protein MR480_00600 [Eubacterium coprostanoligenes]|uniref:hypothetical protein n=1 Tax=Eubacterium coprostanoligenes TaxID=290054 RepID=UPI0023558538|nr:hypothetical protein [Eubacterium coprostanoligenes]MCI7264146.1 hypothetical protein [Eubacterium coprostanoligenes]